MQHLPARGLVILSLLLLTLAGCAEPPDPPTPTRPPGEPAVTYVGALEGSAGQIALIVTETRARAAICTDDSEQWQALAGWLPRGTVRPAENGDEIRAENPATQGRVLARMEPGGGSLSGTYTAPDGSDYPFTAQRLVDAEQIARGAQEGVYRLDGASPPSVAGDTLLIIIVRNARQGDVCAILLQDNVPRSRVRLVGVWQGGFSVFALPDLAGGNGKPVAWAAPGRLGHIDAIALPASAASE